LKQNISLKEKNKTEINGKFNDADENKQQNITAEPLFKTIKNNTFIHR
jgi:hypothetical protein